MFEPIEEDTAISPKPCLATITDVNKSGIDVPAARKVKPMIVMGIPSVSPTNVAHQTMK